MAKTKSRRRSDDPKPIAGRVTPHNLDAEAAVLSTLMLAPEFFDDVRDILGESTDSIGDVAAHPKFFSDANGWIMASICDLCAQKRPIDVVSVSAWLRDRDLLVRCGGAAYLGQIVDATPAVAHVRDHATIVYDKWRQRTFIAQCQRSAGNGYEEADVQDMLNDHLGVISTLAISPAGNQMGLLGSGLVQVVERDYTLTQNGIGLMGIRTQLDEIDARIAGLHDGDLYIVAARPGMGKTSFAMQIALNIGSTIFNVNPLFQPPIKYGVPVFSLEMPSDQLKVRMVCTDAAIDLGRYRNGNLGAEEWERIFKSAAALTPLPIWIDDTPALTVGQIRAKLRKIIASWACMSKQWRDEAGRVHVAPTQRIGAVVIDYLQLMRGSSDTKSSNREQEISEISRDLKGLAKELRVPVIALSQLNRSVETRSNKRPMLSDLRESGAIEQDADTIMFIYRDEYYNPGNRAAAGVAEVIVAKQRNGPTGKVLVRFDAACTRFGNLSLSEKQAYFAGGGDE